MPIVADASVAIRGDLKPFSRDLQGAEKSTLTLGQRLKGVLSPANLLGGLAVGAAGAQITQFLGNAVADASNLEQAAGAVESVFGDASGAIETFGETSAVSFGLSKREVRELGAVLGAQLTGMGYDADTAAEKVVDLEQRGADMAATFGGSVSDAVGAISALLRGERDSIERYGVSLKDADVQARILALGLDTSTVAAEKQAVATASLDLLMESTASSAGAFGREADTLAGKQARLTARMEDMSAEIGQKLMPVVVNFMGFLSDTGIPTMERFLGMMSGPDTQQAGGFFGDIERAFEGLGDSALILNDIITGREQDIRDAAERMGADYMVMRERVRNVMERMGVDHEEAIAGIVGDLETLPQLTSDAMLRSVASWKQADLGGMAAEAFEPVGDAMAAEVDEGADEAVERVRQTPGEMASALTEGRETWRQSWEQMLDAGTDELEKAGRIQEALAALNSVELNEALASEDEARRLWAQQVRRDLIDALEIDGYNYGHNLITTYLKGLRAATPDLAGQAGATAAALRGTFAIQSEPTDPRSPLRGITKWGGNFVKTYADGMMGELGSLDRASSAIAGRLIPGFTPGFDALSSPTHGGAVLGPAGGTTINVYSQSLVPGGPAERRAIVEAITPLVDEGLTRSGRLERRPRN